MSIYPKGVDINKLSFKFDVAALNLPVPNDLTNPMDGHEWRSYLENLPPAQLVRTLGHALDQFHQLLGKTDPLTLPEDNQTAIFSKWYAASIANSVASPLFHWETEEIYNNPRMFKSDIERGIYNLTEFLRGVNSADVPIWESRLKQHREIDRSTFIPLLHKFSNSTQEKTVVPRTNGVGNIS